MTNPTQTAIQKLKAGEIIGIPTETVYGLAVDAANSDAILKLYEAKGREQNKPFQVMVADLQAASQLVHITPLAQKLAEAFLPGPLSLVLAKKEGQGTLAIRIPDHPVMLGLLERYGQPVIATSANLSGQPAATDAAGVRAIFPAFFVLEGGPCRAGVPSTVVDVTSGEVKILREGAITKAQLRL